MFYHVAPDPTLACIKAGLADIKEFKPDVIIALGGGSPMDAAKVMWLMYEVPDTQVGRRPGRGWKEEPAMPQPSCLVPALLSLGTLTSHC